MIPNTRFELVDYDPSHREELVVMWRKSFEDALDIVNPHPIEGQLKYFDEKVLPENRVLVVVEADSSKVVAFMAFTAEKIEQLYVRVGYQQRGIGTLLLQRAKQESAGSLRLFTFQKNKKARRFYEQHGFRAIGYGFEEFWQLEDVQYEWTAAAST